MADGFRPRALRLSVRGWLGLRPTTTVRARIHILPTYFIRGGDGTTYRRPSPCRLLMSPSLLNPKQRLMVLQRRKNFLEPAATVIYTNNHEHTP